jgi:hypothetical protein
MRGNLRTHGGHRAKTLLTTGVKVTRPFSQVEWSAVFQENGNNDYVQVARHSVIFKSYYHFSSSVPFFQITQSLSYVA